MTFVDHRHEGELPDVVLVVHFELRHPEYSPVEDGSGFDQLRHIHMLDHQNADVLTGAGA